MGRMFDAFKNSTFEVATGLRRTSVRIEAGEALTTALVHRIAAVLCSGLPACPHGHQYALDSVEIRWGVPQGADRLNLWAFGNPRAPLAPDVEIRLVCSHDDAAGTFSVGSVLIMDSAGNLVGDLPPEPMEEDEDDDGEIPF